MKKVSFLSLVLMVMGMVFTGCNDPRKPYEKITESEVHHLPSDATMQWYPCSDKDSVLIKWNSPSDHGAFKVAAPVFMSGNEYMRQGTTQMETLTEGPVAVYDTTGNVTWSYSYDINDRIRVNLGIHVLTIRYDVATSEPINSDEIVYPAVAMGIFQEVEKTYPQEATGFYEINVMRYTLAEINNSSNFAGKTVSKATIFELPSDTLIVHDTVVVHDTVPTPPTPGRNWLYNDTNITHVSVNPNGTYANYLVTWLHNHQYQVIEHWDADPFTVTRTPVNYNRYYPYAVTTTGQPTQAMIGTTVNVVNGTADFGGYTVTLTAQTPYSSVPNDINCPFTLTTATMEADGPRVYAVSEGTTVNVKINANIPTPADTVNHFNGNVVYWCITASYKNSAQSSADVDWFLCVVTLESGQYKVYYSPLASTAAGLSFTFKGTITSAEYSNLVAASNFTAAAESGLRCGLAMAYHHNDNSILDITAVKYSANTNQVKYYYLSNIGVSAGFHSAHSAIGQTIGGVSSGEPVREGGIKTGSGIFTFVYNGDVVK